MDANTSFPADSDGRTASRVGGATGPISNPPRILVVSHEATRTGAPRVAVALLGALRGAGWSTTVVHRWGGPLTDALNEAAGAHVDEPLRKLRALLRRRSSTKALAVHLERWSARRVIRSVNPDIVWCNTVVAARYAAVASELGVASIVYSHEQGDWLAAAAPLLTELGASARPPLFVGCSSSAADALAPASGIDRSTVHVLHSPVDVTAVRERALGQTVDSSLVTGCGTTDRRKGFDVFVEAARRAQKLGIEGTWTWIGGSAEALQQRPDNVRLVGEVADAAPWIAATEIFACPSRSESFPLVVLEAMALERPIVASRLDGIVEQLDGTATLIATDDPDALVGAVRTLRDDSATAQAMGRAARERCESHWDLPVFQRRAIEIAALARSVA